VIGPGASCCEAIRRAPPARRLEPKTRWPPQAIAPGAGACGLGLAVARASVGILGGNSVASLKRDA
jgi:hypothetical protein